MFWASAGSILMFVTVALGAFGAHALKAKLTPDMLLIFETGVRYQAYHALALFAVAWLLERIPHGYVNGAGWCFLIGIFIFSGSLYALSLSSVRLWGAVTPIGGLLFLAGWLLLAVSSFKR